MCVRNDSACRFGSTFFIKKTLFEYVAIDHVVAIEKLPHVETYRPICGNAYSLLLSVDIAAWRTPRRCVTNNVQLGTKAHVQYFCKWDYGYDAWVGYWWCWVFCSYCCT